MAFKLSKQQNAERDQLVERLRSLESDVGEGIESFNSAVEEAYAALEPSVTAYNELLEEVKGFVADLVEEQRASFDGKSEKWQESERGSLISEWIGEWEGLELEEIEIEKPDEVSVPDLGHADAVEGIAANPAEELD